MGQRNHFLLILLAALQAGPIVSFSQTAATTRNAPAPPSRLRHPDLELPPYKTWLNQDVVWIITNEERAAFKALKNDQERDQFIEAFWSRRDPTPDTYDNEYKEEHYRRIVYANEHFGTQISGWKTDRGRIYIMYGPPDKIDSHAAGEPMEKPENGQSTYPYPLEAWHYRYLEGIGQDVVMEFVDGCNCGEYEMTMSRDRKDALLYVPGGMTDRKSRFFDVSPYLRLTATPHTMFKSLEEKLNSGARGHSLAFEVSSDGAEKATDLTYVVPITITLQSRDIRPVEKKGSKSATMNALGRVRALSGKVVETFEETMEIDASDPFQPSLKKELALKNGRYRIEIAVENADSGDWGTWIGPLKVGD